ncbi:MAG: hypothetical protein NWF03_05005 [Candidatus Bathyarchaeota archaeon]|nr:hypothetical protein [Candidatus Bathyarchaeota archaeon]
MSGVELSEEQKAEQVHQCSSCMNTVVDAFNHIQQKLMNLETEKTSLQTELTKLREEHEKKEQLLLEQIKALEETVLSLKQEQ